ncbi:hypothetical protein [Methylorubrum extorquens]|uniref:Uncharacterized protein n=4 Tax=Methylorubrum extorquens TaxID=408 RepID=C5B3Q5_METEA|nr:hypothetical protein [Methylorubrum extorquens]AWI87983.1 hypothetical protein C0214_06620 [Methylobacterium sp. DM1]ACK81970.1 conserved hypothetical protein [Methylorubrum extorquens CM4]ACS43087.1 Hypothetical protein MexAM1_META2p0170 [Methylorubrum extorquens AM1]EHP94621.1 hypothetical protein MetexDRAFT_0446 [Methylorubrum extorquens DSM 13060]MCG5248718.1 hypothetical protein [Methylorubrum extorquens]
MKRTLVALLAAGMLAGAAAPASAVDGHGNASNPERAVPNTGNVSGGPAHRDDPRVRETQEKRPDGKPVHSDNDGHAHGHSHGRN